MERKHEGSRSWAWKRYIFRPRKPHESSTVYKDGGELHAFRVWPKANHYQWGARRKPLILGRWNWRKQISGTQTQDWETFIMLWNGVCVHSVISAVSDSVTPLTVALQSPLSMGFSWEEDWSGLPFPTLGIFLTQGIEPASAVSCIAGGLFTNEPQGKPFEVINWDKVCQKDTGLRRSELLSPWSQLKDKFIEFVPSSPHRFFLL